MIQIIMTIGIAIGLSMDCFAVSIAYSTKAGKPSFRLSMRMALAFGIAQGIMPVIGWYAGQSVESHIRSVDHWVSFGLLGLIGGKMIWEYFSDEDEKLAKKPIDKNLELFILAIATSIDALAVGLSLALIQSGIAIQAILIGIVCFGITWLGTHLGAKAKEHLGSRMELVGGAILIMIGLKVLMDHLMM